ncbi:MAG: hypothetical protein A3A58_01140 [Candidatus Blackburnbacteria bacterium RIFCSPLOWO2_01_FULL_41_27]|uniref:Uncharacterized protein n=1 Tax=Candidatus Blackburnbacteria bacterium RIFCSPLOWO2_01_FULL_41_27 TaxID=1797520 RepID=A0A1G1VHD5_9BACT|nr:MAG: hypothetical protein A3A58_01140 [Candidatus Blackburnbacteria bacterium RIFCSPLOWO2_01_FULL_41_27]
MLKILKVKTKIVQKLLTFIVIILLTIVARQFFLYKQSVNQPVGCGGDWSYNVKCGTGTSCKSLGQGPLAGGTCEPYLSPLFDKFGE